MKERLARMKNGIVKYGREHPQVFDEQTVFKRYNECVMLCDSYLPASPTSGSSGTLISACAKCWQILSGRAIEAAGRRYHKVIN